MLVKLRMSVEDAITEFATIVHEVYAEGLRPEDRTSKLRCCMNALLTKRGLPIDLKLKDKVQDGRCVGFVVTALQLNVRMKVCLRTYPVQTDLPSDITVIDAALATCALQPEFLPLSYGAWYEKQEYVGAGLGANNPVRQVITEARSYFRGEHWVSVLLSLGSGHPGILALDAHDKDNGLYQLMQEMMWDSEQEAEDVQQQITQVEGYFRFSVEQGMQRIENRAKALNWISTQTDNYLKLSIAATKFDEFIENMPSKVGRIKLKELVARINGTDRKLGQPIQPTEGTSPLEIGSNEEILDTEADTQIRDRGPRQIEAKAESALPQLEGDSIPANPRRAKLVGISSKSHLAQSFVMNYLGIQRWSSPASY